MGDSVRVILVPQGEEEATDRQIVLDLTIDARGVAVGPFPAFGRIGDFRRPGTLFPFTLMGDGRLDYGAHAGDVPTQDKLAIRSEVLAPRRRDPPNRRRPQRGVRDRNGDVAHRLMRLS